MKKYSPFLIMFAAILWSLDGLLRRELYTIPASTLVALEHMVGVLLFLPFLPKFCHEYRSLDRKGWSILILTSIVGGVLGTILYTAALAKVGYIQYSVVILLQKTQPLFAIALAALILKEKIEVRYIFLALMALVAAYFLSFPRFNLNFQGKRHEIVAALMALGAACAWGSATVLGKLVLVRLSFGAATTMRFLIVIPVAFGLSQIIPGQSIQLMQVSGEQWLYLAGIACSSGAVAYLIYYKGLQHTPARIATFSELTYPVSAILIGYLFLHERLDTVQFLAAAALLAIIVYLSLSINKSVEKSVLVAGTSVNENPIEEMPETSISSSVVPETIVVKNR